ncbi:MAG: histidine phosphatase family protein [Thermodesulfobacteriota bacterium]
MAIGPARLYLVRHGEVVNHGVYNGHTDVDITPWGVKQMESLRDRLREKKIAAVYASDLRRTLLGAKIIGQPHDLQPQSFPQFREMNFGRWQGLTYGEVMEKYPEDIPQWLQDLENFRIPQGESLRDVQQRVLPKLEELIAKHQGEDFVLVCHGAVNRLIIADALQLPLAHVLRLEQDYGCLNIIEYTFSWKVIKLING